MRQLPSSDLTSKILQGYFNKYFSHKMYPITEPLVSHFDGA